MQQDHTPPHTLSYGEASDTLLGLIPAAGKAKRLGLVSTSKELLPVRDEPIAAPKPVITYVLEAFKYAGITDAVCVIRHGKEDILATLDQHTAPRLHFDSVCETQSVPQTLATAYATYADRRVAFGFPDILFSPVDAFAQLDAFQRAYAADVALGLFPSNNPSKTDMVEVDAEQRVLGIVIKPRVTELRLAWIIAIWTPRFSALLHDCANLRSQRNASDEHQIANVFMTAIERGLKVCGLTFSQGRFLDIGTPADLESATRGTHAVFR